MGGAADYRNGYGKPRRPAMSSGTITVRRPRAWGLGERFESRVLPLFLRRTREVRALLPELHLHGPGGRGLRACIEGPVGRGGVVELFIQTLKEQYLYLHDFESLEEARHEISQFFECYNHGWLLERHSYRTPAPARQELTRKAASLGRSVFENSEPVQVRWTARPRVTVGGSRDGVDLRSGRTQLSY